MSSGFTTVELKPTLGFVVKSSTTTPSVLRRSSASEPRTSNLLEPVDPPPTGLPLPTGPKVFINIAWDTHVPPPPPGPEDIIQRAMLGMDEDEYDAAQPEEGGYYLPVLVVVSAPCDDTDKKGARVRCSVPHEREGAGNA
ncbi:hypothetical protein FIBSPDRAFT_1038509 [Athelia psychrophila]|uniref:PIH1 N-terminal domain-containing protein n=1 Tax=Athelia psychrophila TaxID=1759441 RepID=A0A166T489_9AGAM|nr:hypothetical protein FIBSPDRAFT_1038509 [Fibularhizoctonia sp. CBS 109695]